MSASEAQVKQQRVREYLAAKQLAGIVLGRQCNFAWYTCGGDNHVVDATEMGVASLVITPKRECVVTTNIEAARIADEEVGDLEIVTFPWHQGEKKDGIIHDIIGAGAAVADDGSAGLPPPDDDFAALRYVLTPEEMDRYRTLGAVCSRAMTDVCANISPGMRENVVEGRLRARLAEERVFGTVVLIAADERIEKYRHPIVTNRPVRKTALIVLCGRRWGLICSVTRLVHFGSVPAALRVRHEACAAVDAAFILGTRAGRSLGEIFEEATAVYAERGFADEWHLHHQGGLAGYCEREIVATPGEPWVAEVGHSFAWNPSITGTKSEDTILLTESGPEVISGPVDWPTLDAEFGGATIPRARILEL